MSKPAATEHGRGEIRDLLTNRPTYALYCGKTNKRGMHDDC